MKHLYFFLIVSFCSSLLSCTNDDSFLAHDFETQQNRALSIYTGNYNIYQIAKKVSLPSASTTKLNSVITNCCNDNPVIKWLHNYAKDKKYNFSDVNITSKGMNGNPAAYDHSTKILSFLTSNAINNTTYPEEFIHMNQDNVYFGGIGTYEKTAMLNIEFESKFIQDVIHAPYGTQLVGSGNKYYNSYINWMYSFNPTSSFPNFTAVESGYNNISWWQFAQDFKESSPSPYKDYVMSNVLVAKLIDIIGNNFGKNTKSIALASSKNSTILPQSFKYKGKTFIVKENIIKNAQNKISFANIAVSSTLKINKCIPVDSIVRQVFSKERIKYLAERNEKIICLTVFDGQSGKIEEVSFSLTFAPDITEKEIFNLEQIIKNQLFSFEDTNTQEHYRFVQAIDFTLLNK
ncbi:MAG TPA: hypothetical protein PLT79_12395 [Flavobacterium sp.]|nr:hypothetical protein [Flavobacterium sp.]